ncbi:hypothetical protein D3C86_1973410 [compost metagenome]
MFDACQNSALDRLWCAECLADRANLPAGDAGFAHLLGPVGSRLGLEELLQAGEDFGAMLDAALVGLEALVACHVG